MKVWLFALSGLALGVVFYRTQSPYMQMMNQWGVVAFASMGASLGCLICDPKRSWK
jgi:hypothetical protein